MNISIIIPTLRESKEYFSLLDLKQTKKHDRTFYETVIGANNISITISDPGPVNCASATEAIIIEYKPNLIINSGSAGSHELEILPGDIVIGNRYTINFSPTYMGRQKSHAQMQTFIRFTKGGEKIKLDHLISSETVVEKFYKIANKISKKEIPQIPDELWPVELKKRPPEVHVGTIGSEDMWTTEHDEIEAKRSRFGHITEDKESSFIAQVCKFHEIDFIAIRCVSDNELILDWGGRENVMQQIEESGKRAARVVINYLKE